MPDPSFRAGVASAFTRPYLERTLFAVHHVTHVVESAMPSLVTMKRWFRHRPNRACVIRVMESSVGRLHHEVEQQLEQHSSSNVDYLFYMIAVRLQRSSVVDQNST